MQTLEEDLISILCILNQPSMKVYVLARQDIYSSKRTTFIETLGMRKSSPSLFTFSGEGYLPIFVYFMSKTIVLHRDHPYYYHLQELRLS